MWRLSGKYICTLLHCVNAGQNRCKLTLSNSIREIVRVEMNWLLTVQPGLMNCFAKASASSPSSSSSSPSSADVFANLDSFRPSLETPKLYGQSSYIYRRLWEHQSISIMGLRVRGFQLSGQRQAIVSHIKNHSVNITLIYLAKGNTKK